MLKQAALPWAANGLDVGTAHVEHAIVHDAHDDDAVHCAALQPSTRGLPTQLPSAHMALVVNAPGKNVLDAFRKVPPRVSQLAAVVTVMQMPLPLPWSGSHL